MKFRPLHDRVVIRRIEQENSKRRQSNIWRFQ